VVEHPADKHIETVEELPAMPNLKRLPKPLMDVYEWQYDGLCMGLESSVFFSPDAERGAAKLMRERRAKAICAECPVIEQCRDHALSAREAYGVWGGLSADDRAELLGQRLAG
jgi:WhiB family redox-sensing transcriptional regulator